ncbi:MAG: InlB B-repeat-containing protein [Clostridia bacterium]|nr:InlB B-repeat-containing protein [Clostridia bacterium]
MKIKIFSIVLLFVIVTSICSCDFTLARDRGPEIWIDDIQYREEEPGIYNILWIQDKNREGNVIYVPDMIGDKIVNRIGGMAEEFMAGTTSCGVDTSHTERIYFPWTIEGTCINTTWFSSEGESMLKYVISATTKNRIGVGRHTDKKFVVPREYYEREHFGDLPANIAYLFNYEENPNNGYFFVDLLEESGKLTKPPYDPRREGYTFAGWYKDTECTEQWDFESDEVIISFDEEKNRIYEEFCLYAKWIAE